MFEGGLRPIIAKYLPNIHYEKSCILESHYLATNAPKQSICNYTIIRAWKYEQLINKMSHQKIKELYYGCNLVTNGAHVQCNNIHIIYIDLFNYV
jgi:hypothetical protein